MGCSETIASADNHKNSITDIEELHKIAVREGSTTYIDPATGFMVFTELAHLKRGKCCGNACRHCPYEWEGVKNLETSKHRRPKSQQKERESIQKRIDTMTLETSGKEHLVQIHDHDRKSRDSVKGGRTGGLLTHKNVPYTKTGDKGTSVLGTGERRPKDDVAFEAMGTVDELCSVVGLAHAELNAALDADEADDYGILIESLLDIMSRLFDIGSHIAKPPKKRKNSTGEEEIIFKADGVGGGFSIDHVDSLEDWIDTMTEELPELTSFILPTGGKVSAQFHVARTVCRRAERRILPLVDEGVCDPNAMRYLNRLSDFLFTAARWSNFCEGRDEVQYSRPKRSSKQRGRVVVNLKDNKSKD